MVDGVGKQITYDALNRPVAVTYGGVTTTYTYAPDGSRLTQTGPSGTTVYLPQMEIRAFGTSEEVVITYPVDGIRVTHNPSGDETSWLHRDHLGSVIAITGEDGREQISRRYLPFGTMSEARRDISAPLEGSAWIGEHYDPDAGLQYLNARFYDPALGRFIQPDWWDVRIAGVGTNRYAYSANDPINRLDPGGNMSGPADEDPTPLDMDSDNDGTPDFADQTPNGEPIFGVNPMLDEIWPHGPAAANEPTGGGQNSTNIVPGGGLRVHENKGGHTIERHVGKTDSQLLERLVTESKKRASTFSDRSTAENAISSAIEADSARVQDFLRGSKTRHVIDYDTGLHTGRIMERGSTSTSTSTSVRVVINRNNSLATGYNIVTAYPIP